MMMMILFFLFNYNINKHKNEDRTIKLTSMNTKIIIFVGHFLVLLFQNENFSLTIRSKKDINHSTTKQKIVVVFILLLLHSSFLFKNYKYEYFSIIRLITIL